MDPTIEKSCLEEISTNIFDSLEKVTLKTISNNWQVSNTVAQIILNKWLEQNKKRLKELVKEFVIQGINTKGTFSISVVPEDKKEKLQKIWKNFDCWLYSIETKSNSKSLDLPANFVPIYVKNLQLNLGNRDLHIPVKQEPSTSQIDTTKIKTPFGMIKPLDKKEIKKEKCDENIKKEEETEKVKIVDPSKEELPPKISLETKSSSVKSNAKKNGSKTQQAAQGKGSISSFFSKPSSKISSDKQNTASTESSIVKKEPEVKVEKEEISRKRSTSPEVQKKEAVKKVHSKKLKLKNPPNKKRSRIQVMEDSSEEEEEDDEPQKEELPDSKFIKFDREMTPENQIRSPTEMDVDEVIEESKKEDTSKRGHKNKAKRWVTKRFETDDGFIRTEKVLEEYSDDENENENNDDNIKKNSQSQEKAESPSKQTPQKRVTPKTKVKDMPKTKQGSIMNFFSKK